MSPLKSNYYKTLHEMVAQGEIPEKYLPHLELVFENYRRAYEEMGEEITPFFPLLVRYLEMVSEQCKRPFQFPLYHQQVLHPFNYYQFGMDFMRPLFIKEESHVANPELFAEIELQLAQRENVVLLANHQAEPDPQAISFLIEEKHPKLAQEMIFVAGHRVTQDPLAIPFSLGRNLLCIYSKKHIEHPPELKREKQLHNQKTMLAMLHLLSEGGKCIYVAPSGGRDRPDAEGVVDIAPFDPQSIEMFRIISKKSDRPTHFYPLALETYHWFPPPSEVAKELGELRPARRSGLRMAIGKPIAMDTLASSKSDDKKEERIERAELIWQMVRKLYWSH